MADQPTTTPATFGVPPSHPFVDDPGGVFATDAHRRVLGHLPTPDEERTSLPLLCSRIAQDGGNPLADPADIERIANDLAQEGFVVTDNGLRMTAEGLDAIQGGADHE